jgi:cysteine-rich repeat protein
MSLLSVFLLAGTGSAAVGICGDGFIDPGEECDDGDTNDYNACRNDCTIYVPYFSDVLGTHWAFEFVQQLYEYAISQGYPDGTYKPGNNVTRAEMSAYIIRTIGLVGDITSVTAGTGLSGGGDSGDVTLDADTTYLQRRVSSSCPAGQSIREIASDGTVTCEVDDNSGGDITGVTAGIGMAGGGTSGVVTLNADTTYLQRRVGSSCPTGQSIRAIASNGTVTCEVDDSAGDNLGNHIAAQNIQLNGNWLSGDGGDEGIYVKSNGVVGIGTTNPLQKLHVSAGNIRLDNGYELELSTENGQQTQIYTVANDLRLVSFSAGDIDFCTGTSTLACSQRMVIQSDGDVGIGVTSPAYRVEVGGGDVNTTDGGYRDSGSCVAGTCASDVRLKENINPLSGSLEKINSLEPVSYNFTDPKYGPGTQIGLIAQEVEKVFPEWVVDNAEGYKSIRYGLQIQMHLIQAMKELKKENEVLKAEIEALKTKINTEI